MEVAEKCGVRIWLRANPELAGTFAPQEKEIKLDINHQKIDPYFLFAHELGHAIRDLIVGDPELWTRYMDSRFTPTMGGWNHRATEEIGEDARVEEFAADWIAVRLGARARIRGPRFPLPLRKQAAVKLARKTWREFNRRYLENS